MTLPGCPQGFKKPPETLGTLFQEAACIQRKAARALVQRSALVLFSLFLQQVWLDAWCTNSRFGVASAFADLCARVSACALHAPCACTLHVCTIAVCGRFRTSPFGNSTCSGTCIAQHLVALPIEDELLL